MHVIEIIPVNAAAQTAFEHHHQGMALITKVLKARDPGYFRALFRTNRDESHLDSEETSRYESEFRRLIPWETEIRKLPSFSLYATRGAFYFYVRTPDHADLASEAAAALYEALTQRWPDGQWELYAQPIPLRFRHSMGDLYTIPRLCLHLDVDVNPFEETDVIAKTLLTGLVQSTLRERDPLSLLERLPNLANLGFDLESIYSLKRMPSRFERRGQRYFDGTTFQIDLALEGPWMMGKGAMFGYGLILSNGSNRFRDRPRFTCNDSRVIV